MRWVVMVGGALLAAAVMWLAMPAPELATRSAINVAPVTQVERERAVVDPPVASVRSTEPAPAARGVAAPSSPSERPSGFELSPEQLAEIEQRVTPKVVDLEIYEPEPLDEAASAVVFGEVVAERLPELDPVASEELQRAYNGFLQTGDPSAFHDAAEGYLSLGDEKVLLANMETSGCVSPGYAPRVGE